MFARTRAFSWQNSVSLCPASFCTSRPNLPVIPGISWLPPFAFKSPTMKRTFLGVLVLKGLVGLCRTVQLHFFSISIWGIDLDYCDAECFTLVTNKDHSVTFEIEPRYCISDSFVDYEGYSISSKRFLPHPSEGR